jgi:hypothetical protein
MGIAHLIGGLVMEAVRSHPTDRSALQAQGGAGGQKVFHPLGALVTTMREQAVIAHADAEASREPPKKNSQQQRFPAEKEKCGDGADVKQAQKKCASPI